MSDKPNSKTDPNEPAIYQIRIKGHLGSHWTEWYKDMTITLQEDGTTLLIGPVVDQAALYGLLRKVRDLGLPLLSVNRIQPGEADEPDTRS